MRDLTKSLFRFSWAMSMLGVRQMSYLLKPGEGWDRSASTFDALSHAAEGQMGESVRSLYRAGDELQAGMVNAAGDLATGEWSKSGAALGEAMKRGWEAVDRSWPTLDNQAEEAAESVSETLVEVAEG